MKALFVSYNQALTDRIMEILDRRAIRGYTLFPLTHGRGSYDGEPHMGNHTWPAMNTTLLAVTDDQKIAAALDDLRRLDEATRMQGLRAFAWDVTDEL